MAPETLGAWAATALVLTLLLQIADAVALVLAARSVRDEDEPDDQLTRGRVRELIRVIGVTAAIAVLLTFAVDATLRALLDGGRVEAGVVTLLVTTVVAFAVGLVAAVAAVRRERPRYARIRRDLRDRPTLALEPEELEQLMSRLARADRAAERRVPSSWVLRILGLALVLAVAAALVVRAAAAGDTTALVAPIVAAVLAVLATGVALRADLVRRAAVARVLAAQRAEVVALLERARIPRRSGTPGLRDRVARALAILREQQR